MDIATQFLYMDFSSLLLSIFIVASGLKTIISALEWLTGKCGIELKWLRRKQEDHKLLLTTIQNLNALQEKQEQDVRHSISHDDRIKQDLEKLTSMFIEKAVDDMRWEIINFAAKISEQLPCTKESYQHCLHIYEKYEKMIEENGLTNGEVELSMEIIHQSYKEKLKTGF